MRPQIAKHGPHEVDVIVGANIRRLRLARGVTQQRLADQLGVTWQQFSKYESARNRITPGRLVVVAIALEVTIAELFEGTGAPAFAARSPVAAE